MYPEFKYRLLAFWDKDTGNLVIATHGFVKKTQKTPDSEIAHAEALRKKYYNEKK
ncbi:MAG: type II toxin-antitoxin system RelE/ParE family toxin [Roseburia sp.]|nr:type II toxin-antitoxin system RelE/ParE family toxin [Roseburia sp.]